MRFTGCVSAFSQGEDIKEEILDQSAATLETIIYNIYWKKARSPKIGILKIYTATVQTLFGVVYRIPDGELNSKTAGHPV